MTPVSTVSFLLAQAQQGGEPPASPLQGLLPFLPIILIFIIFMWMSSRSQRKKERERQEMLDSIKPQEDIVTIGGIHGRVVNAKEDRLTLCVDQKNDIRVTINRSAVARRQGEGSEEEAQQA
jgi:preprotein translocase subunit YajC